MNGKQQKNSVAARFATAWKREVRAEEGLRRRQENLEAREKELVPGLTKRTAMLIMVAIAAAVLLILLLYGK